MRAHRSDSIFGARRYADRHVRMRPAEQSATLVAAGTSRAGGGRMRLLLISDTHIPQRARRLPEQVWREVDAADVVVHAGDWVSEALLDQLQARARRLIGVYGNNDGPALRARLPAVARDRLEGLRLAVVHETGPATGREQRCTRDFPDTDVLVFGHSHIPWDSVADGGPRLLNPGSPTDRRRQPHCTYLTARVDGGALTAVELHPLPAR
jgi:putative phosphoesterase